MHEKAVAWLRKIDPEMRDLIRRVGACTMATEKRPIFQALVSAIAHQQLHGKAAANILARVSALFPGNRLPPPAALAGVTDEQLRAAGLSGAKTAAIRDLAEKSLTGIVPTKRAAAKMSDQEIIERISQVRGVGKWTVEMLLIFTLDRPDVWPVDDYGVRTGYKIAYGLPEMPKPKELDALGEKFRPHRSVAAWYFWRATDLTKA